MEAKVKRTTDNVENLIKELEKQYVTAGSQLGKSKTQTGSL